ncbi:MAG: 2-isopropylmalate synthase [Hyphomonadaceae bacterium]|nr:2-isopropylmalate synthase [Clostridia bacterium]
MTNQTANNYEKYVPIQPIAITDRKWPTKTLTKAPLWCSVDLRDGNQALVIPMNLQEKLDMFKLLVDIGFKEIEIGFPSASDTEYKILRTLIEQNHIPDDVTVQVLVQARKHLIEKTFESVKGAKNAIIHFYNSTSTLQRKVVFKKDMQGIIDIAVEGAKLIRTLADQAIKDGTNIRFEYSPESFTGTEIDFAIEICAKVMAEIGATPDNKIILNLPATVEMSSPNIYADQIEYFCKNLPNRHCAIISIHPHNDRGTAVAAAELAMLAGAERVEGTLFGNGERTGNVDLLTIALNMFTQAIDPKLNLHDMNRIKGIYEHCTKMVVHERHPYAGELVFTAFSGSHQDAISKGFDYMKDSKSTLWEVPYLPIDPSDLGREYEPIIRINSQSGKGGAAFVLQTYFGYQLPKGMHPEFGNFVKTVSDQKGDELSKEEIFDIFEQQYVYANAPYALKKHKIFEETADSDENIVHFEGVVSVDGVDQNVHGTGNGPIDAFFHAISGIGVKDYSFVSYDEHALSSGSDSKAIAYIKLQTPQGGNVFGVGVSANINIASIRGILSAINRSLKNE